MEIMQGKTTRTMTADEFELLKAAYREVLLDIGTGDGRFVLDAARRNPNLLAIGVDACRENLRGAAGQVKGFHAAGGARNGGAGGTGGAIEAGGARNGGATGTGGARNGGAEGIGGVLFVIAGAGSLPVELRGLARRVTINFPWGSLRDGLLAGNLPLLEGLRHCMLPGARLEVRLNASALAEAGWELLPGGERVREQLARAGFHPRPARLMNAAALRGLPSTWAKRLAFSRLPEAVYVEG